jgi:uncharacterized protein YndB with AHSA1/START domain
MMKHFSAETEIEAPPEAVWRVLADISNWPAWDRNTDSAQGVVEKDGHLTFRSAEAPGQSLQVKITALDEPYLLEWTGGVPMAFKSVRTHRVTPKGDKASRVEASEELSGTMLAMIERQIPDLDAVLREFLSSLKKRVETGAP